MAGLTAVDLLHTGILRDNCDSHMQETRLKYRPTEHAAIHGLLDGYRLTGEAGLVDCSRALNDHTIGTDNLTSFHHNNITNFERRCRHGFVGLKQCGSAWNSATRHLYRSGNVLLDIALDHFRHEEEHNNQCAVQEVIQ